MPFKEFVITQHEQDSGAGHRLPASPRTDPQGLKGTETGLGSGRLYREEPASRLEGLEKRGDRRRHHLLYPPSGPGRSAGQPRGPYPAMP